jgi:hypothetical protein
MAQTKRKRRSKHRGTPAGTIQARGRTSRPPSAQEKKRQARADAREKRLNMPPTWKNSLTRAGFAAALLFVFLLVTGPKKDKVATALIFTAIALAIYVPAGYYIELFLWRRRQKRKLAGGGDGR